MRIVFLRKKESSNNDIFKARNWEERERGGGTESLQMGFDTR
jgi:hypothetical protein